MQATYPITSMVYKKYNRSNFNEHATAPAKKPCSVRQRLITLIMTLLTVTLWSRDSHHMITWGSRDVII